MGFTIDGQCTPSSDPKNRLPSAFGRGHANAHRECRCMNRHASSVAQKQIRARRSWGHSIRRAILIPFASILFAIVLFASVVGLGFCFAPSVFFPNVLGPKVFAGVDDPSVYLDDLARLGRLFAAITPLDDGLADDHLTA